MKRFTSSKSRMLIGAGLLFVLISISNSCSKTKTFDNPGTGTANTPGSGGSGGSDVLIEGMSFNPVSITINAGSSVTWTNKDAVNHSVTSDMGLFDSGMIVTNGTYSYTFMTAGTYSYHCSIHPSMTASVTVSDAVTTPVYPTGPGY